MLANASIDQRVQSTNPPDLHRDTNRLSAGRDITHLGKAINRRPRNPGNMRKGEEKQEESASFVIYSNQ
jgi:hypothetical protein